MRRETVTKRSDRSCFLTRPPPYHPSLSLCTYLSEVTCPSTQAGGLEPRLFTARFLLSACLASSWPYCPGACAEPCSSLGSHVALILLFSGPAWDILRFPSLPLWESLSPPLRLASGDAREGAVASKAWLGTRDLHPQLRQHDERHLHPLWICMYSPSARWPALCTPAPPCPALPVTLMAHRTFSFIFLVRE